MMRRFSFVTSSLPSGTFMVESFKGIERIFAPYRFEVMLVSDNLEIDSRAIVHNKGTLIFHREGGDIPYHGIVSNFDQLHEVDGRAFYLVHLVPRFWWLSVLQSNQVFLDRAVPDFLTSILQDGGLLAGEDFEFRLQGSYKSWEYVCQYGETHLNFLSRWCEREGIYYYFEQTEDREKVIFTDTLIAHTDSPSGGDFVYAPPSGLETLHEGETVRSFRCHTNVLPAKVFLKDYNYRKPSLEITGEADVDRQGRGTVYFYHEHFRTPEEGSVLAGIRAESIICKGEEYFGEGSALLFPGYTFTLARHFRRDFNKKYLILEAAHEGDQTSLLPGEISAASEGRPFYTNRFTAIPASTQFRPAVLTKKPRVSGTILARIDAAGSGQYAELDEMGRYKVLIPFDLSGRKDGKASSWIRMATPYGGGGHGMHFPLHKGTEVLLTFVNGDPDRPIITAAIPNPLTPSPVMKANQTANVIQTGGGNKIHIEDQDGNQHIHLSSPVAGSSLRLGAPSSGDTGWFDKIKQYLPPYTDWKKLEKYKDLGEKGIGIHLATSSWLDISAQIKTQLIFEDSNMLVIGLLDNMIYGGLLDAVAGGREILSVLKYWDISIGKKWEYVPPEKYIFVGVERKTAIRQKTREKYKAAYQSRLQQELGAVQGYTQWKSTAGLKKESWVAHQQEYLSRKVSYDLERLTTKKQTTVVLAGDETAIWDNCQRVGEQIERNTTQQVVFAKTIIEEKGLLSEKSITKKIARDLDMIVADLIIFG